MEYYFSASEGFGLASLTRQVNEVELAMKSSCLRGDVKIELMGETPNMYQFHCQISA